MSKGRKRRRPRRTFAPKPKVPVKRADAERLKALIERASSGALSEEECAELRAVVETLEFVVRELDDKNLTLRRLRALFGLSSSEKLNKVLPPADGDGPPQEAGGSGAEEARDGPDSAAADQAPDDDEPAPGHGRNGADAYAGAERVFLRHEYLCAGDHCPTCKLGKVYEQRHRPQLLVRVEGQAPLKATVYERQTLRCNLCGEIFAATPPKEIGEKKYDPTAGAMTGLLRYATGVPFNRLERLEGHLGIPLPASTQWDVVRDAAEELAPVYGELIRVAAQGEVLHNDDSSMRVLSLMKENDVLRASAQAGARVRTGIFVSGVVSVVGGHRVALFFTGRKHAGENLAVVLAERAAELDPPLHMSDGLGHNAPAGVKVVRGCCLAHGRRTFVEIAESFPAECRHVLETIAQVYKHDDECRELVLDDEERLAFHVERSKPLLDELEKWFERQFADRLVEPNSSLGGAINYMLNHWDELTLFLREPGAPLDNNECERALKKAILHRRNSLFYRTLNGARVGDVFMSLIYTTELDGGNPFDYLTELLRNAEEVARDPAAWLPWTYLETLAALKAAAG